MRISLQLRLTLTTIVGFFLVVLVANGVASWRLSSLMETARAGLSRVEGDLGAADPSRAKADVASLRQLVTDLPDKAATASLLAGVAAAVVLAGVFLAVLNRYLMRPLELLAGYADRVGQGDAARLLQDAFHGRGVWGPPKMVWARTNVGEEGRGRRPTGVVRGGRARPAAAETSQCIGMLAPRPGRPTHQAGHRRDGAEPGSQTGAGENKMRQPAGGVLASTGVESRRPRPGGRNGAPTGGVVDRSWPMGVGWGESPTCRTRQHSHRQYDGIRHRNDNLALHAAIEGPGRAGRGPWVTRQVAKDLALIQWARRHRGIRRAFRTSEYRPRAVAGTEGGRRDPALVRFPRRGRPGGSSPRSAVKCATKSIPPPGARLPTNGASLPRPPSNCGEIEEL